jgi:DNA polymerase-1
MPGGHSLEAWGRRLGEPKGDFNDYSQFTSEMLDYCIQDTAVTRLLYLKLSKRMREKGYTELSCSIEHGFAEIINEQQRNGFFFDLAGAIKLRGELQREHGRLGAEIRELFPPVLQDVGTYTKRKRQDGSDFESYRRHCNTYPKVVDNDDGTYTCLDFVEFNINSPAQRVEKLLSLGWEPTKFTPKTPKGGGGNPQVDEDSLLEFAETSGIREVKSIAEYLVLQGRISMLDGWIRAYNPETHAIHGKVFSCGAGSRRCTHNNPNTANVPSTEVPYGRECRELWRARPGRIMVGVDAKSCQARIFGHYLNNDEVARRYYDPDTYGNPHIRTAEALGDADRYKKAKNAFFAYLFGASEKKLKATWGAPFKGKIKKVLLDMNPGLEKATNDVQREWNRNGGRIRCIDGGYVVCPAEHAALNYQIQSAEKVQMALAAIVLRRYIRAHQIDAFWVGNIHDEWQFDCLPEHAEKLGGLACRAMRVAGRFLKFRVPMDGSYAIGSSWADTH